MTRILCVWCQRKRPLKRLEVVGGYEHYRECVNAAACREAFRKHVLREHKRLCGVFQFGYVANRRQP